MTQPPLPARDAHLLARLGSVLAPAYEIEGEIGRGGMAIVYRARDPRLKRGIAVKLLPPELAFRDDIRSRFLREAETSARLSHPNIVPIYTVDERDGLVYFVMALVEGESVGDRLRRQGRMAVDETRRILREVADALAYAHRHGVVHRDIKPDNVLLDSKTGRAMVTDFGIARAASDDGAGAGLTATGAAIGTPAYMSPEQCTGERTIDGRSDLYSLGAVAYQMLSGKPPFTGGGTPAIMMKQVTEQPLPIRQWREDVSPELERIIMRLLQKDPAKRFGDAAILIGALEGAPVTPPESPRPVALATVAATMGMVSTDTRRLSRREERRLRRDQARAHARTLTARVRAVRVHAVTWASTSAFLFVINEMTSARFLWCVFPIMGMGLGLAKQIGALWADGLTLEKMFTGDLPPEPIADVAAPATPVLPTGPHAPTLRQAQADLRNVHELVTRLTAAERALIPEVTRTAEALHERIVSLAAALERLDEQIGTNRVPALDERIAQIEHSADETRDRERRLTLLRRQRNMMAELVQSRETLHEQFESASLMLTNLALDVLKVRSSGLDSALPGIASVTQEARALSREIGYVLSAADELRDIKG